MESFLPQWVGTPRSKVVAGCRARSHSMALLRRAICAARRFSSAASAPLPLSRIDHVCVVCRDVGASIEWYKNVLNLKHAYADEPDYGSDPAIMVGEGAGAPAVALLPLADGAEPVRYHNGAHFALRCDTRADFDTVRAELPARLARHRAHAAHDVAIDEHDYGLQLCLFFDDPDGNIVEVTTWVDRDDPRRL